MPAFVIAAALLGAGEDVGVLVTAATALLTALITGGLSVLNWVQRSRETGAKQRAEQAQMATVAQEAALAGLKDTYNQGWTLLRQQNESQQVQIGQLQGLVGQLQGQLSDCRDERRALAEHGEAQELRIRELERKLAP